jgi:hypothetical protein
MRGPGTSSKRSCAVDTQLPDPEEGKMWTGNRICFLVLRVTGGFPMISLQSEPLPAALPTAVLRRSAAGRGAHVLQKADGRCLSTSKPREVFFISA